DKIQLDSELFDTFNLHTSDYSSNFVGGGGLSLGFFKIGGSYSQEYKQVKMRQGKEKTVTLRNEFNHILVDVILDSSCALNPQVKREILKISDYISSNQLEMASYVAQVFVSRYGTHYISRLKLPSVDTRQQLSSRSWTHLIFQQHSARVRALVLRILTSTPKA
ncbi:unnamed protein product, partial [Adineta ricciae]